MSYTIDAACMCSTGKVRKNNEDNFFFNGIGLEENNSALNSPITMMRSSSSGFSVSVFDGMGGENFGESASYAATQCMQKKTCELEQGFQPDLKWLNDLCQTINLAVVKKQRELCTERMGATLVSLCFSKDWVFASNLGDSRAYRLREGELLQLSVDHVEHREGRRKAPLTQHLGINPEEYRIEPYITKCNLQKNDVYLICSDGITDMLKDEEIRNILIDCSSGEAAVQRLVDAALEKGGIDNTTAIVCRVVAEERNKEEIKPLASVFFNKTDAHPHSKKKVAIIAGAGILLAAVIAGLIMKITIPAKQYTAAVDLMCSGEYGKAETAFESLSDYKDSVQKAEDCRMAAAESQYNCALKLMVDGEYAQAMSVFDKLDGYKDSDAKLDCCVECINAERYASAVELMAAGDYEEAISVFQALGSYKSSVILTEFCRQMSGQSIYDEALELMEDGEYALAAEKFKLIEDFRDAVDKLDECDAEIEKAELIDEACALIDDERYEEALAKLEQIDGDSDDKKVAALIDECNAKIEEAENKSRPGPHDVEELNPEITAPELRDYLKTYQKRIVSSENNDTVYLYMDPGEESDTVCELSNGEKVTVIAGVKGFFFVRTEEDIFGWVSSGYLPLWKENSNPSI